MKQKTINRNDPCPCGSTKKYKVCCMNKPKSTGSSPSLGQRKFTAKVISSNPVPSKEVSEEHQKESKGLLDYNQLMEIAYGKALHATELSFPEGDNIPDYSNTKEEKNASQ